jgi:hypothetical protein
MYLRHGLADMLYPAVISLAGCSSAEPASVSYSIIKIRKNVKQFSINSSRSQKLKEENAPQRRWITTFRSIRTSFDFTQLLAAPV